MRAQSSGGTDARYSITIAQPFPAYPLPLEQRCAILTDDSPNLGPP